MQNTLRKQARARTNTALIADDVADALCVLRDAVVGNPSAVAAFEIIETHVYISLRVFAKTNPSKIRDEARACEIGWLMAQVEQR